MIFNQSQLGTSFGINCMQMWYICIQLIPANHSLPLSEVGSRAPMRRLMSKQSKVPLFGLLFVYLLVVHVHDVFASYFILNS